MRVILSCTSTYERKKIFYYGIQSLRNQSLKPDLFLVNLSESFLQKSKSRQLPKWLKEDDVEVNFTEDIGPYTKLLPAFEYATEDDIIITADDDVLYHEKWLSDLISLHQDHKNAIACARARKMEKNVFGMWKNYHQWSQISEKMEGDMILPLGVGGVVYKKDLLDLNFLFDKKFQEISPTTDDLWFRMASLRKDVSVVVDPNIDRENMYLKHNEALFDYHSKSNRLISKIIPKIVLDYLGINLNKNDIYWEKILNYSTK